MEYRIQTEWYSANVTASCIQSPWHGAVVRLKRPLYMCSACLACGYTSRKSCVCMYVSHSLSLSLSLSSAGTCAVMLSLAGTSALIVAKM